MNKENIPPKLKFIDLRKTPEGYVPLIERDLNGNIKMVCYCPHMPINLDEIQQWHFEQQYTISSRA